MRWSAALLVLPVLLGGCWARKPPIESAQPRYTLGAAYEAGGSWYYPAASYTLDDTGLAMIRAGRDGAPTADGEVFDQDVLAAAHQTLQLPAIARVTNLENGLQLVLRVNDRGPARPDRMLAVTRRAAELLRFPPSGVARIRLEVLPEPSHAAVDALGGAPEDRLALTAAPRDAVLAADLPPPGGGSASAPAAPFGRADAVASRTASAPPLRMPEQVTRIAPDPGGLWIDLGRFSRSEYAARQAARAGGIGASVQRERRGRETSYRVHAGPFATVAEADAAFARARSAGIPDARIVIE